MNRTPGPRPDVREPPAFEPAAMKGQREAPDIPRVSTGRDRLLHVGIATLSLGLACLAFHPVDLPLFGWIAFVPWMAWHQQRPRVGTAMAMMAAWYVHFAYMLWWAGEVSPLLTFLVPLLGMPFAAALGFLCDLFVHRIRAPAALTYPLAIVSLEAARDHVLGLTWSSIGYSQWRWLELVQSAAFFRVHGISFAVLLVNAMLAGLLVAVLSKRGRREVKRAALRLAAAGLLVVAMHGAGAWALARTAFEPGPVAAGVQGNIPQNVKMEPRRLGETWAKHRRIYLEGGGLDVDPDLLVFSETSFRRIRLPFDPPIGVLLREPLEAARDVDPSATWGDFLPRGRGQVTILGYSKHVAIPPGSTIPDDDGDGFQEWNVAGAVRDARALEVESAKRTIVPFGEYIPLPHGFPGREALKKAIKRTAGYIPDLTPGSDNPLMALETDRGHWLFGTNICFEIVFPGQFRPLVRDGADFLVNISNDGWYRDSSELDLVHVAARFRAVECGRSLFRVSNTGISTLIDPAGRYLSTIERDGDRKEVEGLMVGQIPISRGRTLWVRYGDGPQWIFPIALGILGVACLVRRTPR